MWNIEHENWVGNGAHNWGGRGLIQEGYGGDRATSNEYREEDIIKLITLDSLNIPKCNFIKIDIQGYEYNMLIGATKLINNFKPIMFLENHTGDGEISAKTKNYLISIGYDFYRLEIGNKEDCILIHPSNPDYIRNLNIINKFLTKYNIIKE